MTKEQSQMRVESLLIKAAKAATVLLLTRIRATPNSRNDACGGTKQKTNDEYQIMPGSQVRGKKKKD